MSWLCASRASCSSALALVGAVVSVVVRFRRARGVERQQLTVLASPPVRPASRRFVVSGLVGGSARQDLGIAITWLGILAIPVAIGVAMLRYRLYEIDRVISRTLVYGALTVILGAAYVGLVLAGQAVFSSFAGGSNLAIAVSTLVVAALFLPLRSRVQRVVDRRFYRRRYDAQRTLESFGARLREQVELDALRADLAGRRRARRCSRRTCRSGCGAERAREPAHRSASSPGRCSRSAPSSGFAGLGIDDGRRRAR